MKKNILSAVILLLVTTLSINAQVQTFYDNFDGGDLSNFTVINNDGGYTWNYNSENGHTSLGCAKIFRESPSSAHDDYLITPQIQVVEGTYFEFWAANEQPYALDHINVKISTTGNQATDFTETIAADVIPPPNSVYQKYSYNLSGHIGENIYIAIQACSADGWKLFVDDVEVLVKAQHDLGVDSIAPVFLVSGNSAIPEITLHNYGYSEETDFSVQVTINNGISDVYNHTKNYTGETFAVGTDFSVIMDDEWLTPDAGTYLITAAVTVDDDTYPDNNTVSDNCSVEDVTLAYCWSLNGDATPGPSYFYLEYPGTFYNIDEISSSVYCGTWADGIWYAAKSNGDFISINPDNGNVTVIGNIGFTGLNGMAYDLSSSTIYGVTDESLYSIDPTTGIATLIGDCGVYSSSFVNLACSTDGILYTVDRDGDDILYTLNSETGVATAIGTGIGIDLSYAQDMEYDNNNGILYLAAFIGTGNSHLHTIDVNTGLASASLGNFQGNQVCALAIPYTLKGPKIVSLNPPDKTDNVVFTAPVSATFDVPLTVNDLSGVTITPDPGNVSASLNADGVTIDIAHDNFQPEIVYNVNIPKESVSDGTDNIAFDIKWSFTSSSTVSVKKLSENKITVFPNPNNGTFIINVQECNYLEITDISGKIIQTQILNKGINNITISESGVYLLKFKNDETYYEQKIIII